MKKQLVVLLECFCFMFFRLNAQQSARWMDYLEEMAVENENEEQMETLFTELSYWADHPTDLNEISISELRRLPFLSDRQIEDIILYKKKYGKWATIYELKNIESLDFETISLLLPFVYVGEWKEEQKSFTLKNLMERGKTEIHIRYDRGLQEKKGYKYQPDSILRKYPNLKYLGEPFYHSFRYSYAFGDRLQFGFCGEKDSGEPFLRKEHIGYDFYSIHLFLKDMGALKSLAIGDYKVSFGQGLVVSNDISFWKSSLMLQPEQRNNGFRRHFSTNETDFFRGIGVTVSSHKLDFSLFYSFRGMDATVNGDNEITSLKTDGIHRVPLDIEKKNRFTMHTMGGNIRYASPDLAIGITGITYDYGGFRVNPKLKPYNRYYFRGKKNSNASVDYLWKNRFVKFYGETAISENKALATIDGIQFTPFSYLSGLVLYRNYSRRYQAYFANTVSQNTMIQNEEGVYIGIQSNPFSYWKFSAYADLFRFPWLRYLIDAPSKGRECRIQSDYSKANGFSFSMNYTYRKKEKNGKNKEGEIRILPYEQHRVRGQVSYLLSSSFTMRTSVESICYIKTDKEKSYGWIFSQNSGWNPEKFPFKIDFYAAYFKTDDYDSRVYSREKNLLYAFALPSFYGKGIRFSSVFHWEVADRMDLSAKIGWTHYLDRDVIGSDLEEIEGADKTDINTSFRWKF
ncbi:helix-hairpin-helix domain-containing protein [Parabacteroides sp. Marseille-P3160]|uniref:helix-hairpin-helix domain-containing protein n=1 Tax=Parabacteroides sp. Marseille-P3160 TaxID=1917887 RepID=UPI0009BA15FB|nr:helix-hairpin-helix domain-containing protein [Parabacteroides sp. Marseille-P3160]